MITCGGRRSEFGFQGAAAPTSGTLDPHGGARRATPLSVWHYGPTLLGLVPRRRPKLTRSWGPIPTRSLRSRRWRSFVTLGVPYDEALRLWPTALAFTRSPNVDTVIGDRYRMRPQDWAIILIPFIARDPSAWGEDAEEFRPDRFLPESSRRRAPRSYKPFGTGERACIGRKLALHEAVLVLARLLHRYDITGDPDRSEERR